MDLFDSQPTSDHIQLYFSSPFHYSISRHLRTRCIYSLVGLVLPYFFFFLVWGFAYLSLLLHIGFLVKDISVYPKTQIITGLDMSWPFLTPLLCEKDDWGLKKWTPFSLMIDSICLNFTVFCPNTTV